MEILTLFDDDTSSIRNGHKVSVIADPTNVRVRHMASEGNAAPVFREAFERRILSPQPEYRFDTSRPNTLEEQTRISFLSWNPGPQRGTPGASGTCS